ncbi:amino acid adenylation domain-containing protein [uncultured Shewanella sp.]|uniref:non-ribosomal peptide synthetase n=1 Tax=uncultured Shewanella sp. TaxID=173975 RepID=UPI002629D3D0|nr:amino acid adenylation domain-containing protein [uncultured Shewanella sp.]
MSNVSNTNTSLSLIPLHCAQENVYFEQLISPNSPMYNIGCYSVVQKAYDLSQLQLAWQLLIDHVDALRLELVQQDDGLPLQRILPKGVIKGNIEFIDFSDKTSPHHQAKKWMAKQYRKVFHCAQEQKYQLAVIKLSLNKYYLFSRFHHLVVDGIAVYRIYEELNYIYSKVIKNETPHFIHYLPQYSAEIEKSQDYFLSNRYRRDKEYWQDFLAQKTPTHLPQYYMEQGSDEYSIALSSQLSYQLRTFCEQSKQSVLSVLMGVSTLYFSRYLDLSELVISTPLHGRRGQQAMRVIGMHSDAVMLALEIDESWSFDELLTYSNKTLKRGFRYSQFPQSHLSRLDHHSEVLTSDISLNYELYCYNDREFDIGEIVHLSPEENHIPLEIRLIDFTDKENVILRVNYQKQYFSSCEVERLSGTLIRFISEGLQYSHKSINTLKGLSSDEYEALQQTWLQVGRSYSRDKTLAQLFEEQVQRTPTNIALICETSQLTFEELNEKADQLASVLRAHYEAFVGVDLGPDTLIGLYIDRSMELIIGMLAILKAGGAYVPLAPEYPQARICYMLQDTQMPFVLTQAHYKKKMQSWLHDSKVTSELLCVDADYSNHVAVLPTNVQRSDLAYVIYTSGTTGEPKGVMCKHRGVSSLICETNYINIKEEDVLLHHSPSQFDAATFEIWGALLNGAQLVISTTKHIMTVDELEHFLMEGGVSILWMTKTLFDSVYLEKPAIFSGLNYLLVGGEALTASLMNQLVLSTQRPKHILNGYGPTECTTFAATYECDTPMKSIPLGKGINTRSLYVLDDNKLLSPIGAIGELYISGAGLARGYLNSPEKSFESFIENPFSTKSTDNENNRLYKTGDKVRYAVNGNLEYLGRRDSQVKVRGYRIELSEIEAAIDRLAGVKQAVVIDYKAVNKHFLAAYIVPEMPADSLDFDQDRRSISRHINELALALDLDGIADKLMEFLPEYMLPKCFMLIDEVPLTLNGKLDKMALPEPLLIDVENYVPPRNEIEKQLCEIWQEILGLEQVGIHDHFFHIGGDSIKAIQLLKKMNVCIDVSLVTLFTHPNIASLCESISKPEYDLPLLYSLTPNSTIEDRLIMIHPGTAGAEVYHQLALKLAPRFHCIGVDNYNLVSETKIGSLKIIALMYLDLLMEAKLHHKPITILGWSLGGNIALEMAYQLELRGYTDVHVYLLDTLVHNIETKDVFKKLGQNVFLNMMQRDVIDKNATKEYLERVMTAVPFENDMNQEALSGQLIHSKVTLFKAEEMMKVNEQHEGLIELDELVNQLSDNNIQSVTSNDINVIQIKDKHHVNIIEAEDIISANILNR